MIFRQRDIDHIIQFFFVTQRLLISLTSNFKPFYFPSSRSRDASPFISIWIQSSGSKLRSWCPGLVYLKLLPSVELQRNTPLEECSSEATRLKRARWDGLKAAISGVPKKSHVKATILSLVKKSANWTIEPRKQDPKISCQIRQGSTWKGQTTEVPLNSISLVVSFETHQCGLPFLKTTATSYVRVPHVNLCVLFILVGNKLNTIFICHGVCRHLTDNGRVTVVMDKTDYFDKMDSLSVKEKQTYEDFKRDPTPALQRKLDSKILT